MAEGIDAIRSIGAFGSTDDRGSGRRSKYGSGGERTGAAAAGAESSASASSAAPPASPETLQSAVQQINARLAGLHRALELGQDPETGLTVAIVRNTQTGEILQQIAGAEDMPLARMLAAWSDGSNALIDLIA